MCIRDRPRGGRGGADPADADQRTQDMAQIKGIDRDQMAEGDGNDIEQPAIEKKVLEAEYALVPEPAGIIGDDQLAVMMLNAFIVGNRIILEGAQRDDHEPGDKDNGGEIISVETRDPCRPAPGRSFLGVDGNAVVRQLRLDNNLGHLIPGDLQIPQPLAVTCSAEIGAWPALLRPAFSCRGWWRRFVNSLT